MKEEEDGLWHWKSSKKNETVTGCCSRPVVSIYSDHIPILRTR